LLLSSFAIVIISTFFDILVASTSRADVEVCLYIARRGAVGSTYQGTNVYAICDFAAIDESGLCG
jgi:hypothetical protein